MVPYLASDNGREVAGAGPGHALIRIVTLAAALAVAEGVAAVAKEKRR
tara:strand:- start:288 stop:431 length:144 start_codon:yes stop_codon:yes gene_type:complete